MYAYYAFYGMKIGIYLRKSVSPGRFSLAVEKKPHKTVLIPVVAARFPRSPRIVHHFGLGAYPRKLPPVVAWWRGIGLVAGLSAPRAASAVLPRPLPQPLPRPPLLTNRLVRFLPNQTIGSLLKMCANTNRGNTKRHAASSSSAGRPPRRSACGTTGHTTAVQPTCAKTQRSLAIWWCTCCSVIFLFVPRAYSSVG